MLTWNTTGANNRYWPQIDMTLTTRGSPSTNTSMNVSVGHWLVVLMKGRLV
jgi:hypothetical protein